MPSENEIQFSKDLRSIKCYALGCFDAAEDSLNFSSRDGSPSATADHVINEIQPDTFKGELAHVWREYRTAEGNKKIEITVTRREDWRASVTIVGVQITPYSIIVEKAQDRFPALSHAIANGVRLLAGK